MDRSEHLTVRGWAQKAGGWVNLRPGTCGGLYTLEAAFADQQAEDAAHLAHDGSVVYCPTAEQAQTSPLLAACAAKGIVERDVIEQLFIQTEARQAEARLLADEANRLQAIGEAWKALAKARGDYYEAHRRGDREGFARGQADAAKAIEALRLRGIDTAGEP